MNIPELLVFRGVLCCARSVLAPLPLRWHCLPLLNVYLKAAYPRVAHLQKRGRCCGPHACGQAPVLAS